jgi:hypothetical protein
MDENDVKEMFQYINDEKDVNDSTKHESTVSTEKLKNFYFNFN